MYFYLHIPKTGGQTIAMRIGAAFPPERAWFLQDGIASEQEFAALKSRYDFVEAHVSGGALSKADDDVRIMCTIRDPIAQIISHYRHIRREPRIALHHAANRLSPAEFFSHFGDHMMNFQTRFLVNSFAHRTLKSKLRGEQRWFLEHVGPALDRITWLVPTEAIDEFCQIWAIEQDLHLPLADYSRNRARPDDVDRDEVRAIVAAQLERIGFDLTLWDIARERFVEWRRSVLDGPRLNLRRLSNAMCPWQGENGAEIRLGYGWYPRVDRSDGISEWWAGPSSVSEVVVRCPDDSPALLEFEVAVLLGIRPDHIRLVLAGSATPLPRSFEQLEGQNSYRFRCGLPPGSGPHLLRVVVPTVKSPMEIIAGATDPTRRSFASQRWRIVPR